MRPLRPVKITREVGAYYVIMGAADGALSVRGGAAEA